MNLKFGENLKQLRKDKNITQEKLAEVLDVSCQSVSRWELGVCYPDVELIPAIANYFGVSIDKLLLNDDYSRQEEKKAFLQKLDEWKFESWEEAIEFVRGYVRKYPNDLWYSYQLFYHIYECVMSDMKKSEEYMPEILRLADKLLDSGYGKSVIEHMVCLVNDEKELEKWLSMVSRNPGHDIRGCLVLRSECRNDVHECGNQRGLEYLEKLATQLDRRHPDGNAEKKAPYQRDVMRVIESLGKNGEIPDGWKIFYAYKQIVLAACLFGMGNNEDGWREFDSAIEKYKYIVETDKKWLELGNSLFYGLKVNKNWSKAIDEKGKEYPLYMFVPEVKYGTNHLWHFLTNPRWSWFDSVRETEKYVKAVEWAKHTAEQSSEPTQE